MRIGVFGGSFDPVHQGHLLLARCCLEQASLDRVLFVPAAHQPLKPDGPVAGEADRLAMLRLAIDDSEAFVVSTLELDRGWVSYMVDTLRALQNQEPRPKLFLLMGADALADFAQWREPAAICKLATPLVVQRAGAPAANLEVLAPFVSSEQMAEIAAAAVEMPPTPISSSEIRQLIAGGEAWQFHVPPAVADYIEAHRLYRRP